MTSIQAIRGMNDILPDEMGRWAWVEGKLRQLFLQYGYHEIRFPILEKTELFQRSIGEVTDIVEKEMYVFLDRNNESLALRPEGTAGCVRAAIEHSLLFNQTQKLWYSGPMYRYERPQKGRYRQFYQVGVEAFGFASYLIEAELILLSARLWKLLGISEKVKLQINCLGTLETRAKYRKSFVEYCKKNTDQLDEDSKRRLETNPLRILDSKNPDLKNLLDHAPKIIDYLDQSTKDNFEKLSEILKSLNIKFDINPKLVRGLDYYTGTVFEWVTEELGAQGTICAGGRYDGLVKELGGHETPAVGFAMGMERIVLLCAENISHKQPDIYVVADRSAEHSACQIAEKLRDAMPTVRLVFEPTGVSFKSQFKRADKSGARFALILGEDELAKNMLTLKNLREESPQLTLSIDKLIAHLKEQL